MNSVYETLPLELRLMALGLPDWKPSAKVTIKAADPDADHIAQELPKDPAALSAFVRQSLKWAARLQEARAKRGWRKNEAEDDYLRYRNIARKLQAQGIKARTKNQLARQVQNELAKQGETKSIRTILRGLFPKK